MSRYTIAKTKRGYLLSADQTDLGWFADLADAEDAMGFMEMTENEDVKTVGPIPGDHSRDRSVSRRAVLDVRPVQPGPSRETWSI